MDLTRKILLYLVAYTYFFTFNYFIPRNPFTVNKKSEVASTWLIHKYMQMTNLSIFNCSLFVNREYINISSI